MAFKRSAVRSRLSPPNFSEEMIFDSPLQRGEFFYAAIEINRFLLFSCDYIDNQLLHRTSLKPINSRPLFRPLNTSSHSSGFLLSQLASFPLLSIENFCFVSIFVLAFSSAFRMEDELDERFVEACHKLEYVEYLNDLICSLFLTLPVNIGQLSFAPPQTVIT